MLLLLQVVMMTTCNNRNGNKNNVADISSGHFAHLLKHNEWRYGYCKFPSWALTITVTKFE